MKRLLHRARNGATGSWRVLTAAFFLGQTLSISLLGAVVTGSLPPLSYSIGVWGDFNDDGLMDVLLAGTIQGVPGITDGRFTRLYRNAGNGFFQDMGLEFPQLDNVAAAWGDYDNDGDLDLLLSGLADGTNGAICVTEIYRNDGAGQFVPIHAGLEPLAQGSVAWVDYDNDGALDVFVSGRRAGTNLWAAQLYHNNGNGTFSLAPVALPTLANSRGSWGDYDNDGDADLVLSCDGKPQLIRNEGGGNFTNVGYGFLSDSTIVSPWGDGDGNGGLDFLSADCFPCAPVRVFENDGNGNLNGTWDLDLDMWPASAAWGDADNSGRAALLIHGWVPIMQGVWGAADRVYIKLSDHWQEYFTLGGRLDGSVNWVDFDGDGDLDICFTGQGGTGFWTNQSVFRRDTPGAPQAPTATFTAVDEVFLSWDAPEGTPPAGRGLSYNLRVGRTPGGLEVVSPMADLSTGNRLLHALGNAGVSKRWKLSGLRPGTYYWSVQSIAQNYTGSPFTAEVQFTVTNTPPAILTPPTDQTVFAGSNAALAVTAAGTKPLAYRWRKDGAALANNRSYAGVTSPVLTVSNTQPAQAGFYDVVVTNINGSVTSSPAVLTVIGEPRILAQPVSHYVIPPRDTSFSGVAAGGLPLAYQWYCGESPLAEGEHLSGTTSPTLVIHHAQFDDAGSYWVVVSNAWGMATSAVANLSIAAARYVNVNNPTPASPYTNWATAATVIQDAINAASPGDEVIVTNGVYEAGDVSAGKPYYARHRVALNKPLSLVSVNGPDVTSIVAISRPYPAWGRRGAYLTNGALLAGFTITAGDTTYGSTDSENQRGAGVLCAAVDCIISNCVIIGNKAGRQAGGVYSGTLFNCTVADNSVSDLDGARKGDGGGTYGSNLRNCILRNNSARYMGGGACFGTAINCLVVSNTAVWGGGIAYVGALSCTIVGNTAYDDGGLGGGGGGGILGAYAINSIIVQNSSPYGSPNSSSTSLKYCCTWPDPGDVGNITLDPMFVDYDGGNFRLLSYSPCRDAGTNAVVSWPQDLDGLPRLMDDSVDMGAYEFQHLPAAVNGPFSQSVVLGSNAGFSVVTVGDEPLACQWQMNGVDLHDDARITGSSSPSLTVGAVTAQDAAGYRVVLSNSVGIATSAVASLTILFPPAISLQPANQSVPVGATASFSVLASGTGTLAYQWRKDGTNLANDANFSGSTTAVLQIAGASSNHLGGYDAQISNPYGVVTSSVATLTLLSLGITNQPISRTVFAGTNVSLSVGATGLLPIRYQWRFQRADLMGCTNTSLTLTNVQSSSAGDYDVVVGNPYSWVTSTVAVLAVLPAAPVLTLQPASRVASVGQDISLVAAARGSEPMWCQWRRNGTDLPGANSLTLLLSSVNSSFNGAYQVSISNSSGLVLSTNASLIVSPVVLWGKTNVDQQPTGLVIPASATNIIAIAAGHCSYPSPCLALRADGSIVSWGGNLPVPTNAIDVVAISSLGPGPRKSDNNLALRADGQVLHWFAGYTDTSLPTSLTNNHIVAVAAGGIHQMVLCDDGTVLVWGGSHGETNVPASATNIIAIAAGEAHCLALRADGSVVGWGDDSKGQASALKNVANAIAISAGGSQSLALLANGSLAGCMNTSSSTSAPVYGSPPAEATNLIAVSAGYAHTLGLRASRTIIGWGQTNFGVLAIPPWLTNVSAVAAGGTFNLALTRDPCAPPLPPRMGRPPVERSVVAGQSAVFNALAIGTPPLRYQWYREGVPAAGQTNPWLGFSSLLPPDAGNYQLVAMNDFGAVTSAVAGVSLALPRPQLSLANSSKQAFRFSFPSIAGVTYVTEFKNQLADALWTQLERRRGSGGLETVVDSPAPNRQRFYRVRALYAPAPKLSLASSSLNEIRFTVPTVDGALYVVQYKTNLADPDWLELWRQLAAGKPLLVTDPGFDGSSRFYRVKVE